MCIRDRLKTAAFPVVKTLDEFDRAASSIPVPTLDYLVDHRLCLSCPPPRRRAPPTEPGHGPAGAIVEHIQRALPIPQSYVGRVGVPRGEGHRPPARIGLCGKHHEQRVLPD